MDAMYLEIYGFDSQLPKYLAKANASVSLNDKTAQVKNIDSSKRKRLPCFARVSDRSKKRHVIYRWATTPTPITTLPLSGSCTWLSSQLDRLAKEELCKKISAALPRSGGGRALMAKVAAIALGNI